ncbi:dynamin family protein [Mitsuokella multacida]|uniref:dynamin family protein n=1 Tax=Mitsuokella multacida TaxID=52226 RepID=UPI0024308190|nr:dynamin family protein [Mitsuokella multacida]
MDLKTFIEEGERVVKSSPLHPLPEIVTSSLHELETLEQKCAKDLHVVLMGEVKSGKSTLLNALAGEGVSPVGMTETTAAIINVCYGKKRLAEIRYKNGNYKTGSIDSILSELNANKGNIEYFKNCQEVYIWLPNESLKTMRVVDTPGLNTLTEYNDQLATEYIQRADVVIWLVNGLYPGKLSDMEAAEKIHGMGKRMMAVISHVDNLDETTVTACIEHLKRSCDELFEIILPFAGEKAIQAIEEKDSERIEQSGLNKIHDIILRKFRDNSSEVQIESILDSVRAVIEKNQEYHVQYLKDYEKNLSLLERTKDNLLQQSLEIEQEFQNYFQDWVNLKLLKEKTNQFNKKVDQVSFSLLSGADESLDKELKPEWNHVFSQHSVNEELSQFISESELQLLNRWSSVLQQAKDSYDAKIDYDGLDIQIGNQPATKSPASDFDLGPAKAGTILGGILSTGISIYASGLGPYASQITFAGALSSFALPAIGIGTLVGIAKSKKDFNDKKKELKLYIQSVRHDICRQALSENQTRFEEAVHDTCEKIQQGILREYMYHLFKMDSEKSVQNMHSSLLAYQKNLQDFIMNTPSYQDVTNGMREEIERIKKEIHAAAEEEIAKIRKDFLEHVSDEDIIRRYEAIKKELEDRLIRTLNDKQVQEDARKLLEDEMDDVKDKLHDMREKWGKERAAKEKMQAKAYKLYEDNQELYANNQELKKLTDELKDQIGDLDLSQGILYTSHEMSDLIKKLYQDAEEYIYMSYPWYKEKVTKDDIKSLEIAAENGVKIYVCYGIMPQAGSNGKFYKNDLDRTKNTYECIEKWKSSLNSVNKDAAKFKPVDSHCKIILCEKYAFLGSQNMMSYRFRKGSNDTRDEITMKYTNPRIIANLKEFILNQEKCPEIDAIGKGKLK